MLQVVKREIKALSNENRRAPPEHGTIPPPLTGETMQLRHVQSWALSEVVDARGLFVAVGVGHGKTLIAYGAVSALGLDPSEVLVLLPANLRNTFKLEGYKYAREFGTFPELPVMSYEELSSPDSARILEHLQPKLIICDEAHKVADHTATRTGRFTRYLDEHPDTMLIAMSGTMFYRSILDTYHLLRYALGSACPLPDSWADVQALARCVDPDTGRNSPTEKDWTRAFELVGEKQPRARRQRRQVLREHVHSIMSHTPGFIHTRKTSCDATLILEQFSLPLPDQIRADLTDLYAEWVLPNGEDVTDHLAFARAESQVAMGYFYETVYDDDEIAARWNEARLRYAGEVRRFIRRKGRKRGLDSPALVWSGLERGTIKDAALREAWQGWTEVSDSVVPVTRSVQRTDALFAQVVEYTERVRDGQHALIWYAWTGEAEALERVGVPVCWPGDEPDPSLPVQAVSIKSHGTGKQLQDPWNVNVVLQPPSGGHVWEQLLGRTHRQGQRADEVFVYVLTHTTRSDRALRTALKGARFSDTLQGQEQKLAIATKKLLDVSDFEF